MSRLLAGNRLQFMGAWSGEIPYQPLPEIAMAGRSNVGKSSCINALTNVRGAARVSRTPGRTRTINLFRVEERFVLVDLPGYGFARVPDAVQQAWKPLVEGYLGDREQLRGVVVLVDSRRQPGGMDLDLIGGLRSVGIPILVVATKMDKLTRRQQARSLAVLRQFYSLKPGDIVAFSARTRLGVDTLWRHINGWVAPPATP